MRERKPRERETEMKQDEVRSGAKIRHPLSQDCRTGSRLLDDAEGVMKGAKDVGKLANKTVSLALHDHADWLELIFVENSENARRVIARAAKQTSVDNTEPRICARRLEQGEGPHAPANGAVVPTPELRNAGLGVDVQEGAVACDAGRVRLIHSNCPVQFSACLLQNVPPE